MLFLQTGHPRLSWVSYPLAYRRREATKNSVSGCSCCLNEFRVEIFTKCTSGSAHTLSTYHWLTQPTALLGFYREIKRIKIWSHDYPRIGVSNTIYHTPGHTDGVLAAWGERRRHHGATLVQNVKEDDKEFGFRLFMLPQGVRDWNIYKVHQWTGSYT
jgi:hypothetical protein